MKNELEKWKKEIEEISNCVWKVSLIHKSGVCIEKTGTNLEILEKEVELSALEMNKKIKNEHITLYMLLLNKVLTSSFRLFYKVQLLTEDLGHFIRNSTYTPPLKANS